MYYDNCIAFKFYVLLEKALISFLCCVGLVIGHWGICSASLKVYCVCRYRDLLIVPVSSCPCDTRLLGLECHSMDVRTPVTAPGSPGTASGTPGPPSQGRQCPGAWCQTRTGHPNTHFRFEATFAIIVANVTISTLKQSETSDEEAAVESP